MPSLYRTTDENYTTGEPLKPPNVDKHWKRPNTGIFDTNYGFGMNYYQPMVDQMNVKESLGFNRRSIGNVPFTEDRCKPEFDSGRTVKPYTEPQLDYFGKKFDKNKTKTRKYAVENNSAAQNVTDASRLLKIQNRADAYRKRQEIERIKQENIDRDAEEKKRKARKAALEDLDNITIGTGITDRDKMNVESQLKADDMDVKYYLRNKTYNADHEKTSGHLDHMEQRKNRLVEQDREIETAMYQSGLKSPQHKREYPDIIPEKRTQEEESQLKGAASYATTLTIDKLMEPDTRNKILQLEEGW